MPFFLFHMDVLVQNNFRPLVKSMYPKLIFNQNICCVYSKELSQRDGSFEHTKPMLKLIPFLDLGTDREPSVAE